MGLPKLKKTVFSFLCPILLSALSCCTPGPEAASSDGKTLIAVSILPQSYFTGRIGGEVVKTLVLVGPGQSPHSYEPSPRQMAELAEAKLWILSNTDFESALVPKVRRLYPGLSIADGTGGVRFRMLEAHHHEDGEADEGNGPDTAQPAELDRHTWLGRDAAKIMASHILEGLEKLDPRNSGVYRKNYDALITDIDQTFDTLRAELASLKGTSVFVYHPAFGYFLDEFGIHQEAVETGGKEPTPRALQELIAKARADRVSSIFVQAQFPVSAAETVAESVGAQVVPLDPLAPDWLENIRVMGNALKKGVR